jgi:hypothetical protein
MKTEFVLDYIPRRMAELGYDKGYLTRWRHFQIDAKSVLKIDSENEFYYLIEPSVDFSVKSKLGICDLRDKTINEMQYEHRGKIKIQNYSRYSKLILFIQVIPNHLYKK